MNAKDIEGIALEVKASIKKLNGCKLHNFSIDVTPERNYSKRYRCLNCGGTVDNSAKYWYEKGLKHGGRKHE
jgi:hypothetical protein